MLRRLILVLAWALAIAWAVTSLWHPFGRDQGIFAWVGDTICDGGMPYRDAWEVKGPLAVYPYALTQAVFGRQMWAIRVLDLILLALAAGSLYLIARRLSGAFGGHVAAILLVIWYGTHDYWNTAQPDGAAAMLMVPAIAALLLGSERRSTICLGVSGILVAACVLLKPIYGAFLALPIGWIVLTARGARRSSGLLACASGFVGTIGLVAAWFAYRGALGDLIEVQFSFNRIVHLAAHKRTFAMALGETLVHGKTYYAAVAAPLAVIGLGSLARKDSPALALIAGWAAIALACVFIQDKFYDYHWLIILPPLALVAALGVAAAEGLIERPSQSDPPRSPVVSPCILAVVLVFTAGRLVGTVEPFARAIKTGSFANYYEGFGGVGDFSYAADRQVADYLGRHSAENDAVLVWGFEPIINYLSARRVPTRFGYNYPLTRGAQNPFNESYRREFMEELAASPPLYIVVADQDANNLMPKTSKEFLHEFPELESYIHDHYQLEVTIEDFDLHRRSP